MRPSIVIAFLLLAVAGCDDANNPEPAATLAGTWLGGFAAADTSGALSIRLDDATGSITGEIVLTTLPSHAGSERLLVRGTLDGATLRLELDTDRVPYVYSLDLQAEVGDDGGLTGTLDYPVAGLRTSFGARLIPAGTLRVEAAVNVPSSVLAIAHDGTRLWLSTVQDDYLRLSSSGAVEDTVVVLYGDAHWVSSALTFDGESMLGFLPRTIVEPGGSRNVSLMLPFTAGGIAGEYTLPHRTDGLAFDGNRRWALAAGTRRLYAFAWNGAVLDSLDVEVPDPYHLEWDGASFWTVSWYTFQIFRLDPTGRAEATYDLPPDEPLGFPGGLAAAAGRLWVSVNPATGASWLYRLAFDGGS